MRDVRGTHAGICNFVRCPSSPSHRGFLLVRRRKKTFRRELSSPPCRRGGGSNAIGEAKGSQDMHHSCAGMVSGLLKCWEARALPDADMPAVKLALGTAWQSPRYWQDFPAGVCSLEIQIAIEGVWTVAPRGHTRPPPGGTHVKHKSIRRPAAPPIRTHRHEQNPAGCRDMTTGIEYEDVSSVPATSDYN